MSVHKQKIFLGNLFRISDRRKKEREVTEGGGGVGGAGRLRRSEKLIKKISDQQSRPVRVQSHC